MACPSSARFDGGMPALTRRRNLDAADECRRVFHGDVRAGTTALRTGMPHHEDPWGWGLRGSIPVAAAARTPARHTSSFVSFEQRLLGFFDGTYLLTPQSAGGPPRINPRGGWVWSAE